MHATIDFDATAVFCTEKPSDIAIYSFLAGFLGRVSLIFYWFLHTKKSDAGSQIDEGGGREPNYYF